MKSSDDRMMLVADVFTKAHRSRVMAQIRSRGKKTTEHRLLGHFKGASITGWRRGYPLPGLPVLLKRGGWRVIRVWEHEVRKGLPVRLRAAILRRVASTSWPS